jgi:hypothetical protein
MTPVQLSILILRSEGPTGPREARPDDKLRPERLEG